VLTEAERPASDPPGFPALDIARARAALAYRPRPLRAGLRDYLDWLSSSDRAPAATLGRQ
jgi:nucleoside-diphosphate-sugar epimerase